ncbi:S1 family peptidase [Tenacibaculum sp.]|jgi:hypothetical protein|uniref:S1 family peptidase n=1 Tax=Tenacibaculum sp. TaxID=1906242 RepID=UPI003AA9704D
MKNRKLYALIIFLSLVFFNVYAQKDAVLVCDVKFKNSKFNNKHAGSAFLLNYKGRTFACTAKHVLFFAKTDSMKTISFNNSLKSWSFISKVNPENKLMAGKLLNENTNETLAMPPKGDWLVFEIKNKPSKNIAVYKLRKAPLKEGEQLYFMGYPYKSLKPIKVKGSFIGFTKDKNLKLDVPKGIYNGCSGGPVVDEEGKLVGLVSMGYFNKKENKMIFEPASTDYFKQIVNNNN